MGGGGNYTSRRSKNGKETKTKTALENDMRTQIRQKGHRDSKYIKTKRQTKRNETKRNETKRNENKTENNRNQKQFKKRNEVRNENK